MLALKRLRNSQPEGYQHIFASTTPGRGTKWQADIPTNDEVVALVVGKTAQKAGLGKLTAHDLRRTLITSLVWNPVGMVKDLQEQAGHENAARQK